MSDNSIINVHSVFVLAIDGTPLMPTKPSRARKLLKEGQAKKVWSKFNTFGIQMLVETRREVQSCAMDIDHGTKFEGYSVVCGEENPINIKLDLPDKKKLVKKLQERSHLRRNRRSRNCRRREARFNNRKRKSDWLAPSQKMMVQFRLKVIKSLIAMYPITKAGLENVCFNHAKHKWGKNFSTIEIGKNLIRKFFAKAQITLHEYQGYETSETRQKYGYGKGSDKSADRFESHCSDSLTLACLVQEDKAIVPGFFLAMKDTYRCARRKLHDTQPAKGSVRANYSRGIVRGLRKGLLAGHKGLSLMLTGENKGHYRLSGSSRPTVKKLDWVSSQFQVD